MPDLDELVAAVRERGFDVPLVLLELWRALSGFALAVRVRAHSREARTAPLHALEESGRPSRARSGGMDRSFAAHHRPPARLSQSPIDGAHADWWTDWWPEVAAHFAPTAAAPATPDPLWIDHGTAVLRSVSDDFAGALPEYTLPVGFSEEEGFTFRTGHVLHCAPDALHKRGANASAASAQGTYAVWLEAQPPLDPELLRFTPPLDPPGGATEPLWRPNCSLLRYLRLAVLDAGGFPGCVGLPAFEPLRAALTEGLVPF